MTESTSRKLVLYYLPVSSFSQKVVLALNYLKLDYEPKIVKLFDCEQLEPWYLDINPKGEVPSLKDGDSIFTDSADIIQHLNDKYDTRRGDEKLVPNPVTPLGRQVAELNQELCSVKIFVLTFGAAFHPQHTKGSSLSADEAEGRKASLEKNRKRLEEKMAVAQSPYKECYTYKLTKMTTGHALLKEEASFLAELSTAKAVLQKVDALLQGVSGKTWIFSDFMTVADITLVVLLYRIRKLGLEHHFFVDPDTGKPTLTALSNYLERSLKCDFVSKTMC